MRRGLLIVLFLLCWLAPAGVATAADDNDPRVTVSGNVIIERDQTVEDIIVLDGDVLVRGVVDGDIAVAAGDITIRGTVEGDVYNLTGRTTLGRRGDVKGDIVYGDDKPVLAGGANVGGEVKKVGVGDVDVVGLIGFWLALTISLFLIGLAFMLLAPRAADAVARTAKAKPLASVGVGLLVWILLPIIAGLCFIIVVGIPLGLMILGSLVPLAVLSFIMSGFVIGRLIIKKGARLLALFVGLLLLMLLVLIPFVGWLIGLLAAWLGLGAVTLAVIRAR